MKPDERHDDERPVTPAEPEKPGRRPYCPPAIDGQGAFEIVTLGTKPPVNINKGC